MHWLLPVDITWPGGEVVFAVYARPAWVFRELVCFLCWATRGGGGGGGFNICSGRGSSRREWNLHAVVCALRRTFDSCGTCRSTVANAIGRSGENDILLPTGTYVRASPLCGV